MGSRTETKPKRSVHNVLIRKLRQISHYTGMMLAPKSTKRSQDNLQKQQLLRNRESQKFFQSTSGVMGKTGERDSTSDRQRGDNAEFCTPISDGSTEHPRSKSHSGHCSFKQKRLDLIRAYSLSTHQKDHKVFVSADLSFGEVLGQGFFGQAIKITHCADGQQMVLKELHNYDQNAQKYFIKEVCLLKNLSHPCILKFVGLLSRNGLIDLVTEFIDGGSLSNFLHNHNVPLSWTKRILFARDIAAGMSYLHSRGIMHRDLNSQNCLVRKNQTVVVADFGLAKVIPSQDHITSLNKVELEKSGADNCITKCEDKEMGSHRKRGSVVGNPFWMAPEMMLKGVYDEKVDVFSYGIIICETIARVTADPDFMPRSLDFGINVEVFHKQFCVNTPEPFFMLAILCCQIEPNQRPSFETIYGLCESLLLHTEYGTPISSYLLDSYSRVKER